MTMEMWIASEIVGMQTFLYACWWRWCHCSLSPWRMPVITFWKWGMRFLLLFSILCPSCVRFAIVILFVLASGLALWPVQNDSSRVALGVGRISSNIIFVWGFF